jgi:hypothetical protein
LDLALTKDHTTEKPTDRHSGTRKHCCVSPEATPESAECAELVVNAEETDPVVITNEKVTNRLQNSMAFLRQERRNALRHHFGFY